MKHSRNNDWHTKEIFVYSVTETLNIKTLLCGWTVTLLFSVTSLPLMAQNVGIGVPSPQARFHIVAPSGFSSPLLKIEKDGTTAPYLIIQSNGKIGIGRINPSEALDVSGNIKFSGALMPGGVAGTAGKVLMSQGTGTSPVWIDTALLKDNWGNQVAVTQSPIIGDGTSANPIGLQDGTNAGNILIWNGSQWKIKSSPFDSVCNTAMPNYIQKWTGSQLCNSIIYDNGLSIGMGTSSPEPSALLDLSASNAGFLLPRVSLASYTDTVTIPSPAKTLLVYHTGVPGMPEGFYYWDGTRWKKMGDERIVIYDEVITPLELSANAHFIEAPSAVDPDDKFINFENGTSAGLMFWYEVIPPGVLADGQNYIIELTVLRQGLPLDGSSAYDDDSYFIISDSTIGYAFILPNHTNTSCCQAYGIRRMRVNPLSFSTLESTGSITGGPGVDYATLTLEMNDTSTYLYLVSDRTSEDLRYRATVRDLNILHPSNGLYVAMYRSEARENYSLRFMRVKVIMKQ
ncbi:MAG: hypothetical protein GXO48_01055 [Chlorobi bacterium]|nr:hypothetical protein [Chlorobiota bacterium]